MDKLYDLTGKVAVVTGGSRGLGLEMCKAFAERGADVVVASRKFEQCQLVAEQLQQNFGIRSIPVAFHAGKWDDCTRLIEAVMSDFDRIDVLVNNAGASPLYSKLSDVSEELWDKVIALNVKGPFRLSALAAEMMEKAGGGSIINISSTAVFSPTSTEVPYAMAKSALHTMGSALSQMYHGRVRVNTIVPGAFSTDISKAWPEQVRQHIRTSVPMGRAGNPNEVVGAAVYLASDASSYTNGAVIKIDGGLAQTRG